MAHSTFYSTLAADGVLIALYCPESLLIPLVFGVEMLVLLVNIQLLEFMIPPQPYLTFPVYKLSSLFLSSSHKGDTLSNAANSDLCTPVPFHFLSCFPKCACSPT
jgi:hypothetical protein